MENLETQYCYLNSSTSDNLFNTFVSKRMDNSYQIEFIIGKQVGETDSGRVYKVYRQQRGGETDRFQQESRKI